MQKKNQNKWIIGGIVLALAVIGMSLLSLDEYSVYFYTPDEAVANAASLQQQEIKIGGMVKGGTVVWEPEQLSLTFVLTDFGAHDITVKHSGTPPDMFKEDQGVVVEGRIEADGQMFVARNLMVKHSEEYKAPDQKHSIDKELLERSIFKK